MLSGFELYPRWVPQILFYEFDARAKSNEIEL